MRSMPLCLRLVSSALFKGVVRVDRLLGTPPGVLHVLGFPWLFSLFCFMWYVLMGSSSSGARPLVSLCGLCLGSFMPEKALDVAEHARWGL